MRATHAAHDAGLDKFWTIVNLPRFEPFRNLQLKNYRNTIIILLKWNSSKISVAILQMPYDFISL